MKNKKYGNRIILKRLLRVFRFSTIRRNPNVILCESESNVVINKSEDVLGMTHCI